MRGARPQLARWPGLPEAAPPPVQLCELCQLELDQLDGPLCQLCRAVLDGDPQAWVESGGRTCRRCHLEVPACSAVDGLCPCGGALL